MDDRRTRGSQKMTDCPKPANEWLISVASIYSPYCDGTQLHRFYLHLAVLREAFYSVADFITSRIGLIVNTKTAVTMPKPTIVSQIDW